MVLFMILPEASRAQPQRCHQEHYELVELASEPTANNKTIASFCREEQILKKAKRKSNEEEHLLSVGSFRSSPLNIQFYYPLRPEVRKFSATSAYKLKAALAGPSGSGKSSVLALLLRFDDPREGKVIIVKKDTRECSLTKLGRQRGWEGIKGGEN
ncbi:hypothetical protein NC651_027787 [Populus alba x Populus x berolinensis]|nr:hypothetical protein NC651_027787 [Populus alba x Populus x berolinensis]